MRGTSPIARGVRTFLVAVAGLALTAATLDFADLKLTAIQLGLGLIAAVLAGVFSFAQAHASMLPTATTALGKATATFFQFFLAGAGTVAVAELTTDALANAGTAIFRAGIAALFAAAGTFLQNTAEDGSVTA